MADAPSVSVSTPLLADTKPEPIRSGLLKIQGATIDEHTKTGLGKIVAVMKATNAFPSGPTRTLYTAYPAFNAVVAQTSEQILAVIAKILKHQHIKGNIQRRDNDEQFELLLECNDYMLERINSNLDELAGIRKLPDTAVLVQSEMRTPDNRPLASGSWNNSNDRHAAIAAKQRTTKLLTARNILRPQINFKTPVDNSNGAPFEPRLRDKPNSLKPLAILPEYDDDGDIVTYLHPYEFELTKFEPPAALLEPTVPQPAAALDSTPLVYVDREERLAEMLGELRGVAELAIDLEHHSYRTFQGITCLMQISTRSTDYIVDTLALRDELHVLNEVFTDARVVKVLHGADSDVEWLQRDLSLYLVNVFDTHQAAKRLSLARLSLAYLLKHYCHLDVDKTFQLADWRIRPLPEELTLYARQDTHYLLFVYDVMRNGLLAAANGATNLLRAVYQASVEICKRRYVKPRWHPDAHLDMYGRSKRAFDNRQLHALQAIYGWRDKIARQEDESCGYVLPNHMMLHIAEVLPREMQGILACCNPIPPLVRQHLHTLHQFVLKAREQPLVRPVLEAAGGNFDGVAGDNRMAKLRGAGQTHDLMGLLYCPHDLTQTPEFRDDLPTLLNGGEVAAMVAVDAVAPRSACSAFDTPDASAESECTSDEDSASKLRRVRQVHFVSPYARYLAILPVAEKQRLDEQRRLDEENAKKKLCPEAERTADDDKASAQRALELAAAAAAVEQQLQADRLPLKDFGKRRRGELEPEATPPAPKKSRFEIDVNGEVAATSAAAAEAVPSTPKSSAGRSAKKSKPVSNKKSGQSSSQPVQFDYAQVDFKKFKGGSASQVNTHETTSKYHGKGKNKRGQDKKFNKLLTFNKAGGGVAKRK